MSELRIDPRGVRLLLIDADDAGRADLAATLRDAGYGVVIEVGDAARCSVATEGRAPDLAILNTDTPSVTPATLDLVRGALGASQEVPIIGLTSDGTPAGRARAIALGVQDVAVRPLEPAELRMRLDNALGGGRLRRLLNDRSSRLTEALRERSTEHDTVRESLSILAAMADYHDDDSDRHAQRVGGLAAAIAEALGLSEASVEMLRAAAPLHDIGKVGISRRILLKPGKLSPSEWLHMQHHVDIGAQILDSARSPILVLAAEIARTHHERFDGSGYTAGLRGDEIPLSGRIVAVADVWDTLTHDRPYRPAWQAERALTEIQDQAGAHFDPRVVEAFVTLDHASIEAADGAQRAA